ncbi:MAG: tetratricopeptide repeat protein [Candidatus Tectomicrobia bacterium]|uniref:Tetratricopeptide repeat protein n=1 Tax=Tectimicrobiota bacterium TaxID=2528274 RepID=A0A932HVE3_UNCTE|nr:tetratricopeptide repeat protein [Candidatus Tectomicrobia bacterium]
MARAKPALSLAGLLFLLGGCAGAPSPKEPPAAPPAAASGQAKPPSAPSTGQAIALFNRGEEHFRHGEYPEAERLFLQAAEADPRLHPAFQALGEAREKTGKKKEAAEAYRRALRLKPDDPKAHLALGRLGEEGGQMEAALYHYERAAGLAPDSFLAHFRLGLLRAERGQADAAIHHLRAAVRLDPSHPRARYLLWMGLARRGGSEGYEVELGRGLVEEGNTLPIRFYQGQAAEHFRAGRVEEALRAIQKAVDVNPNWRGREWRGVIEDMERYRRARR